MPALPFGMLRTTALLLSMAMTAAQAAVLPCPMDMEDAAAVRVAVASHPTAAPGAEDPAAAEAPSTAHGHHHPGSRADDPQERGAHAGHHDGGAADACTSLLACGTMALPGPRASAAAGGSADVQSPPSAIVSYRTTLLTDDPPPPRPT